MNKVALPINGERRCRLLHLTFAMDAFHNYMGEIKGSDSLNLLQLVDPIDQRLHAPDFALVLRADNFFD